MALLVNGEYLADREFFEEFQRLQGDISGQQMPVEALRHSAEERVIQRALLRQMAVQAGLTVSPEEVEEERRRRWGSSDNSICGAGITEALKADLLIGKITAQLTRHVFRPSKADVEKIYKANSSRFHQPERVQASHIVKNVEEPSKEAEARDILEKAESELASGKSFSKVADHYSDCSGSGGAIGWIARGEMVEEFDEVVFALKKGEYSPIFRTAFGWHIAFVAARKDAGVQPLEEIRTELARYIYDSRREDAVLAAVAGMARKSTIVPAPEDERGPVVAEETAI